MILIVQTIPVETAHTVRFRVVLQVKKIKKKFGAARRLLGHHKGATYQRGGSRSV